MPIGNETWASLPNRLVILGFGTIGTCVLALLHRQDFPLDRILVLDAQDRRGKLAAEIEAGLEVRVGTLTRANLGQLLGAAARPGDLLLNLSVCVDSIDVVDWCQHHGVLYVDTAMEVWEDVIADFAGQPPRERTEYFLHQRARRLARESWRPEGPTAVVTHGANPGLVSHFAKAALEALAEHLGLPAGARETAADWAELARASGTKVIHVSERDTQVSDRPKRPGEFVNTWSIPGFVEEAMMPAEFGWGSHEKRLPERALEYADGPRNAICLERPGAALMLRSWVPLGGPIAGLALAHNESVTLSDYLTLTEGGQPVYRPTVAFVYQACDAAMASLHECWMRDWRLQDQQRIMARDIVAGRDELGVLLLGNPQCGWWFGSQLDIEEARGLVPESNPTAIQVAAGALAAVQWALANPARGYCEPEALPHRQILDFARPYLGPVASQPCGWSPLEGRARLFDEPQVDWDDPWQFHNFLLT